MDVKLDDAVRFLTRAPAVLRSLVTGLHDEWLDAREGPDTFSTRDVLGHLIHGEETDWIPRMEIILQHGESVPFTPFDRFIFRERYGALRASELLDLFEQRRASSLERLASFALQPADFERAGTHPEFRRVTLGQLLATWAAHDFTHFAQISRVLAKQYREAVGPWKAYLRVMQS
jgi:hypothetical protein